MPSPVLVVADSANATQSAHVLRLIARRLEKGDLSVLQRAIAELDKMADQVEFMADTLDAQGFILRGKVEP
jgi:hypothetical protein